MPIPLTDAEIYGHLAGVHTVGVYPLLPDDGCHFLAVDFDDARRLGTALISHTCAQTRQLRTYKKLSPLRISNRHSAIEAVKIPPAYCGRYFHSL